MPIKIDPDAARRLLGAAFVRAESGEVLQTEWLEAARAVGAAKSKTYTAALGTALLAKAVAPGIDPFSIKATPGESRAYSARSLCHGVLVPFSREAAFDLGATGKEPLNNQPFFRYERMDAMDRVRDGVGLEVLLGVLRNVDQLDPGDTLDALAAFIRVRREAAAGRPRIDLRGMGISPTGTISASYELITADPEGGKRGQALVAAVFDLAFENVNMGRINDPSRRMPGDVQAMDGARVLIAAEVRQKPVDHQEAMAFAEKGAAANVATLAIVCIDPRQARLNRDAVIREAEERFGVFVVVIESVHELITTAVLWSGLAAEQAFAAFPETMRERLEEIEASDAAIEQWRRLLLVSP